MKHTYTSTLIFDYCQFGEDWQKPTQVLAFNNKAFNISLSRKCQPTKSGGETLSSRSSKPYVVLKGKSDEGKFRIAIACPYLWELCRHIAPTLVNPEYRKTPGVSGKTGSGSQVPRHGPETDGLLTLFTNGRQIYPPTLSRPLGVETGGTDCDGT